MTDSLDGLERTLGFGSDDRPVHARAVEALYRLYGIELEAFLTGVLRDRHLAAEIVQIVYRKALEYLTQNESAGEVEKEPADEFETTVDDLLANWQNPRGWLFRVAWNEAMLARRVQTRHRKLLRKAVWNRDLARPGPDSPDSGLIQHETVAEVRQAIEKLPEEQRVVVFHRIYQEQTFAVIAEELGVPLGTVLTRMRLAMQKLERVLTNHSDTD